MPKIFSNASQPKEYIIMEQTVEKSIQHRSSRNGQNMSASTSAHHFSQMYQTLKKTVADKPAITEPNYKTTKMNSDIDHLRIMRESFKKFSERSREKTVNKLEAERQRKLEEVQKLEKLVNLGKEAVSNIRFERKLTENSMQQTLSHFRALCQQFEQTAAKSSDNINGRNKSIDSLLQDLNS